MPYHHSSAMYNIGSGIFSRALLIILAASALLVSQYDRRHNTTKGIWLDAAVVTVKTLQWSRKETPVPDFIENPSSAIFALSCSIYALAAIAMHQLHGQDKYQNTCLAMSVPASILLGTILSGQFDILQTTQVYLLPCGTLASFISAITHYLSRSFPKTELEYITEKSRTWSNLH